MFKYSSQRSFLKNPQSSRVKYQVSHKYKTKIEIQALLGEECVKLPPYFISYQKQQNLRHIKFYFLRLL